MSVLGTFLNFVNADNHVLVGGRVMSSSPGFKIAISVTTGVVVALVEAVALVEVVVEQ